MPLFLSFTDRGVKMKKIINCTACIIGAGIAFWQIQKIMERKFVRVVESYVGYMAGEVED